MWNRDVVIIDWIRDANTGPLVEVGDELVSVEVPVDPRVGAPAHRAAEHTAVELGGRREVVDRHREMKAMTHLGHVIPPRPRDAR